MRFFPLVWRSLWRRKVRTIFTLLSIFVAFLLFGLLMTIRGAFSFGVDIAGLDRLMVIHKTTIIMPLPVAYRERIEGVSGVQSVTLDTAYTAGGMLTECPLDGPDHVGRGEEPLQVPAGEDEHQSREPVRLIIRLIRASRTTSPRWFVTRWR